MGKKAPAKKAAAKKPVAKKAAAKTPKNKPAIPGARKAAMPRTIEPELATLVDAVPPGAEWVHEIKYDGYRVLCKVRDGEARLITRHGKDWTDRFAPIARAAEQLPFREAILDGEVVVLEPNGTTSFQSLQNALAENRQDDLVYFAFDLLYLDGYDLRDAPLLDRKAALLELLAAAAPDPSDRAITSRGTARGSSARPATTAWRGSSASAPTSPTAPAAPRTG